MVFKNDYQIIKITTLIFNLTTNQIILFILISCWINICYVYQQCAAIEERIVALLRQDFLIKSIDNWSLHHQCCYKRMLLMPYRVVQDDKAQIQYKRNIIGGNQQNEQRNI